ncbi:C1 family peptidase [Pseudomonas sp. 14P_8.1_Bac3]|uniref:C1 family peptidase n=1 Tax=Pseudomonas sp. 14P_8.1_Bac3 TaxID=2971621 RepID=UPI0021C91AA9|nr:C1 family peptidase [Pseudomonas sp. 14P_8.1_Bac3]MCU1759485.1 C1 family peptidase [Pseudomonas sp. 14P_8.1_Bac3]
MPASRFSLDKTLITLDARPDRLDLRDRLFTPRVQSLPPSWPADTDIAAELSGYLARDMVLYQGNEGACTGFGLAAVVNFLLWRRDRTAVKTSPRQLYHLAKLYDEWPGEDYAGSSCRGALKGWHKHGVCAQELWPYTVKPDGSVPAFEAPAENWAADAVTRPMGVYYRVEKDDVTAMMAALYEAGALYVSANVHQGWALMRPKGKKSPVAAFESMAQLPVIKGSPTTQGGHAFALIGYTSQGFIVQNSWSTDWGFSGFAILTFEDWLANGTDAWTVSLGVPIEHGGLSHDARPARSKADVQSPYRNALSSSNAKREGFSLFTASSADSQRKGPALLTKDQAYGLTIVMENNGSIGPRLTDVENVRAGVKRIVYEAPQTWYGKLPAANKPAVLRIAIIAHGGLNSEQDSINRICAMAPYFLENGIYPLFVTWRTGALETLADIIQDALPGVFGGGGVSDVLKLIKDKALEGLDRTVELATKKLGGDQWSQMKQNAEAAAVAGFTPRGLVELADNLKTLIGDLGQKKVELHLIGHSAGSLINGHLIRLLWARGLPIATSTLMAPACTLDFANQTYRKVIEDGGLKRKDFHIHLLSDQREQLDNVVGAYHKSLLYLVSRAYEELQRMPLLGMANALDGSCQDFSDPDLAVWNIAARNMTEQWNNFYWGNSIPAGFAATGRGLPDAAAQTLHIFNDPKMNYGAGVKKDASHGGFDNDVNVITSILLTLLRQPADAKLTQPVVNLNY